MLNEIDEKYINTLMTRLTLGVELEDYEIKMIGAALRKANNFKQTPYYEVVYHDEYDKTESRIMNPVNSSIKDIGDYMIQCDRFELEFNRYIPKRS